MNLLLNGFLEQRTRQIIKHLRFYNGQYALAEYKHKDLWSKIELIISRDTDIMLSDCDRMDFLEYFELDALMASIEKLTLYRQGYMDCVKVFKEIGVL